MTSPPVRKGPITCARAAAGAPGSPGITPGRLWRLSNTPRPVEPRTMRFALGTITGVYVVTAAAHAAPTDPLGCYVARLLLATYGLIGTLTIPRARFAVLRLYLLGYAVLYSLGVGYTLGMLGNSHAEVAFTGLITFVTLLPLLTGNDFLLAIAVEVVGHAVLLGGVVPAPAVPIQTIDIVIGSHIVAGTIGGLTLLAYRVTLYESLARLEGALAAKTEFLNTMSHELRSPLNVVVGYAQMVGEEAADPAIAATTERITASACEVLRLVENTMQVGRLEAGKLPLDLQDFALAEVVHELDDAVRALPEARHGVGVEWHVSADLPTLHLDRLKVKEIVQNLVSNALKFTRDGRVSVEVAPDRGDRVRIVVRDTGPGIPAASQSRIFEMFDRAGVSHAPGAGLGLYIVKRLVDLMQGEIAVTSAVGVGTTFTVWLPRRLAHPSQVAA